MNNYNRYARQTALGEIGIKGQQLLAAAKVLIVGIGGLGSPIAMYLSAAGVGHIGLCDADSVALTNLQRQILYTENEIGLPKTECAAKRLNALNSDIIITSHQCRLTEENATSIISQYDIVIDGCDNFNTRYIIDDTCRRLKKTYIYGAITDYSGQVAIFNYQSNVSYSTLYPDREYFSSYRPVSPAPVIGTTPAVIGSIQANQAIMVICHIGQPLFDTLLEVDLLNMTTQKISLS